MIPGSFFVIVFQLAGAKATMIITTYSNWYRDWELFEGFAAEWFLNKDILCHWWSETLGHQKSLTQAATESVLRWSEILKLFVHILLFLYFTLSIMCMHEIG